MGSILSDKPTTIDERRQFAEQNCMSMDFVNWFFDEKKEGCGNAWFIMAAAMWEAWKGRDNREAQPVAWLAIYHGEVYDEAIGITRSVVEAQADRFGWESALTEIIPLYRHTPPAPAVPDNLAAAVNRLLDCDGTRGHFSAIRCSDAREEVERLLAQPVSSGYKLPEGWIACTEQTPDADGVYWCWFGKEEPSVIQQRVCIWINRNNEWCDSAVTHWMPLPAAPAQGEK
ncbi:TPA: DUF551 domain-containing protein [Serratia marcescens]|nr:DUF551 domain-containing protein [Serratia marcescens]